VENVVHPFVENLTGFPAVKEFWKSVKIWQNYRYKWLARCFGIQCSYCLVVFYISATTFCNFCYRWRVRTAYMLTCVC